MKINETIPKLRLFENIPRGTAGETISTIVPISLGTPIGLLLALTRTIASTTTIYTNKQVPSVKILTK